MDPIYLDYNLLDRPFAAIHMAKKELARMAQISSEMVIETKEAFLGNDLEAADAVLERELIVNNLPEIRSRNIFLRSYRLSLRRSTRRKLFPGCSMWFQT